MICIDCGEPRKTGRRRCHECHKKHVRDHQRHLYATDPENRAGRLDSWKRTRERNPDRFLKKQQNASFRYRYGISFDEAVALRAAQGNHCAICDCVLNDDKKSRNRWVVDHDHDTGAVRAVLCQGCNLGLGGFQDSTGNLVKAVAYLVRHAD